jgi:hypothetical protein
MRGTLTALLLSASLASAADREAPAAFRWEDLRPHLKAAIFVVGEGPHLWGLAAQMGEPPPTEDGRWLRAVAVDVLKEAHDDLAWAFGEVLNHRLFVSVPVKPGDVLKPRPEYVDAIVDDPLFANPLRRFADALLRSRGRRCADCLANLPAARDVSWPRIREYIQDFVHVSGLSGEARVDLNVATTENRIPDFHLSDHDLAAAVYSAMRGAIRGSPDFIPAIRSALDDELSRLGDGSPEESRSTLNQRLPEHVIKDPRTLGPILAQLPDALERHSLHCVDCPRVR